MNGNSHDSSGLSMHVRNRYPRGRSVLIALLLVLAIGSPSQAPAVLAAPAAANDIKLELNIYPEKLPRLCVNQMLKLYAGVSKTIFKGLIGLDGKEIPIPGRVTGPEINGSKVEGVGTFEKVGGTGYDGAELSSLQGENVFIFKSDRPGTATLRFTTFILDSWIGANEILIGSVDLLAEEITINVGCKFKATTIGEWHVPGPANISVVAISDDAEVKAADSQTPLTGSTTVNWVVTAGQVGDCIAQSETGSSQVDWTGNIDDKGQLVMDAKYQTAEISLPVFCVGSDGGVASGSTPVQLTPDPLQVSLISEGGVFRESQVLQGPESMSGFVTIVVVPVEEDAASFIPGGHEARVGPVFPGWAMQWDDFSSLLGALLALH